MLKYICCVSFSSGSTSSHRQRTKLGPSTEEDVSDDEEDLTEHEGKFYEDIVRFKKEICYRVALKDKLDYNDL